MYVVVSIKLQDFDHNQKDSRLSWFFKPQKTKNLLQRKLSYIILYIIFRGYFSQFDKKTTII